MGRTILCPHCKSTFNEDILKQRNSENICLVCGKTLDNGEAADADEHSDWITWYYYGFKNSSTCFLEDKPIDLGERFYLIKEFKAPPKDPNGTYDAVKAELRKYVPDAFDEPEPVPKVQCPYCFSTEIQMVPKRFSLLTGFLTGGYERVCLRCQRTF